MDAEAGLMRQALAAALLGPEADPNPRVGCVVTDPAGQVVGVGHHGGAGTPHAEVAALRQAAGAARGGAAYVTLEPCDHRGRTGPCSLALLEAGITRVRYAVPEPSARAAGGAARLATAGIDVAPGPLNEDAEAVNRTWLFAARTGRPFVTWKCASTLDGRIAARDGSSRWITGPAARAEVHALRARCGAVVVGTGTALADDPALTVRDRDGRTSAKQPLRVVIGTRDLRPTAKVRNDDAPTLLLATHDLGAALAAICERGIHHVLLEGGATLAAAFVGAGLVDEVISYVAPALLGAGPAVLGDLGVTTIADAIRFEITDAALVGGDVRITARPLRRS